MAAKLGAGSVLAAGWRAALPVAGGFAAAFELPQGLRRPVVLVCCDGIGTKLRMLRRAERLHGLFDAGTDLVAMCVNDLVCAGGKPWLFLDYYACARLDEEAAAEVLAGVAYACRQSGCVLAGGETAELPGMLAERESDIAGFAVGLAEQESLLGAHRVKPGDCIIALASSGPHSNGYSLIGKIFEDNPARTLLDDYQDRGDLLEALFAPTRLYTAAAAALGGLGGSLRALAHITGGGLPGNLPRVLPDGCSAKLSRAKARPAEIFIWLAKWGELDENELRTVFNCGIGMVAIVAPERRDEALGLACGAGEKAWVIGSVAEGGHGIEWR